MVSKRKIALIIIIICVFSIFGMFNNTPFNKWFNIVMLPFSTYGHYLFFKNRTHIPKLIKKWYGIGLLIMIVSTITSYVHYGQSLIDSFVATQFIYRIGLVILIYYLMLKYKINRLVLFKALTSLGWTNLFLYIVFWAISFSFVTELNNGETKEVSASNLNESLLVFVAIYYYSLFLFSTKYKYLFYTLIFFSISHLYEIQRVILLDNLMVLGIGFLLVNKVKVRVKLLVPGVFIIMASLVFLFSTPQGLKIVDRFNQAAKVFYVTDKSEIDDSASAVRISETSFAIERFMLHPVFGNGYYRSSNKTQVVGDKYFYPLDIGLFGVLYTLGLFGIIIFLNQYKFLFANIKIARDDFMQLVTILNLVFLMVFSLSGGTSINNFVFFLFFVQLIGYGLNKKGKLNKKIL